MSLSSNGDIVRKGWKVDRRSCLRVAGCYLKSRRWGGGILICMTRQINSGFGRVIEFGVEFGVDCVLWVGVLKGVLGGMCEFGDVRGRRLKCSWLIVVELSVVG